MPDETGGLDNDHIYLDMCCRGYVSGVSELKHGLDALGKILQRTPAIIRAQAEPAMPHPMPPVHQLMKRAHMLPPCGVFRVVLVYMELGVNVLIDAVSRQLDESPERLELVLSFTMEQQISGLAAVAISMVRSCRSRKWKKSTG